MFICIIYIQMIDFKICFSDIGQKFIFIKVLKASIRYTFCLEAQYLSGTLSPPVKSFSDVVGLQNLVKEKTCFTKNHASSIDVFLTNRPRLFQKTCVFETGLSDYHGLVVTLLKAQVPRLKAKRITYRCFKSFNENEFLSDVRKANLKSII